MTFLCSLLSKTEEKKNPQQNSISRLNMWVHDMEYHWHENLQQYLPKETFKVEKQKHVQQKLGSQDCWYAHFRNAH